jgi:hypothetical protein
MTWFLRNHLGLRLCSTPLFAFVCLSVCLSRRIAMADLTVTQRPAAVGGSQVDLNAGGQGLLVTTDTADVDEVSTATVEGGTALHIRLSDPLPAAAGHLHLQVDVNLVITPGQTFHGTIRMKGLGKGNPVAVVAGPYGRGGGGHGGGGGRGVNGRGGKGRDRGGP